MATSSNRSLLTPLMAIADRYAHQLVATADMRGGVLLIEQAGALDIMMLDGRHADTLRTTQRLVVQHHATSVALLIELPSGKVEGTERLFCIIGESSDGETDERHYRMRRCGRGQRLTPVTRGSNLTTSGRFRPFFPVPTTAGPGVAERDASARDLVIPAGEEPGRQVVSPA